RRRWLAGARLERAAGVEWRSVPGDSLPDPVSPTGWSGARVGWRPVAQQQRQMNAWERTLTAFAASRAGSWFFLHVANPIDKRLLPASGGRLSLSIGQPVLCLEVRGAKSGAVRRTPLLFAELGDELVLVASATGRPRHPAWYHNVAANPRVKVYAPGGRSGEYLART